MPGCAPQVFALPSNTRKEREAEGERKEGAVIEITNGTKLSRFTKSEDGPAVDRKNL